jgi:nucleoside-diphosphate-sugar epimerase
VDVRDIALAHVRAMEVPEAGGKRFFITAGHFDMKEVADIAKKNFPEYADKLPTELMSDKPDSLYGFDNSRSKEILNLEYRALQSSVVDTIKFLQRHHI